MDRNLKRIILLSVINGVTLYYLNKWLIDKEIIPSKQVQENEINN